ncbi:Thiamine-monophosphate kinase [Serratia symbiotica]|nr:Thiamine-monophosphate kinase [Serratia symbiotica]
MVCGEFDLINRYFNRYKHKYRKDVKLGIGDDCALLTIKKKQLLAISTDTLVSGVHFLPEINPDDLGWKALAVNLSDLSAMGATPSWLSLALTVPNINEGWIKKFSDSIFNQLNYYGMQLIGGDTTSGPLSLTLTIYGFIPMNCALTRKGANIGDWIYVTGTVGDSAAGLEIIKGNLHISNIKARNYFINRHLRPQPRILQGKILRKLASSAIDISDGLISDLKHILKASFCSASINLNKLPLSHYLIHYTNINQALYFGLMGGEDYELCFTVPDINRTKVELAFSNFDINCTCIGHITSLSQGIKFYWYKNLVKISCKGFDHFKY